MLSANLMGSGIEFEIAGQATENALSLNSLILILATVKLLNII